MKSTLNELQQFLSTRMQHTANFCFLAGAWVSIFGFLYIDYHTRKIDTPNIKN